MVDALLLAAGKTRTLRLRETGAALARIVTMDMDPSSGCDVIGDCSVRPLPFADASFDEIHAYHCLEHWGAQGDWRGWFAEMDEYHRLLRPGGTLSAIVPAGESRFHDPGHTRFFTNAYFGFLTKWFYEENDRLRTQATDYRWAVKNWWECLFCQTDDEELRVVMRRA